MTVAPAAARDRFRAAYENRYTWDDSFPGYTADVELRQGNETYRGRVAIGPDLSATVEGVESPEVRETLERQVKDIVTHRQRSDFEKAHGENQFELGETDETGAVEILVQGKAMGSSYKVRDREICHVQRDVGPMRFVIDTRETLDTGSGYLPIRTEAQFYSGKTGELVKEMYYEDAYERVGDYFLLKSQLLRAKDPDGSETLTEIEFSNLALA